MPGDLPSDLDALLSAVVELAATAGRAILDVYATEFTVNRKADASPVTEADVASQTVILAGLKRLTPGMPVIAEEAPAPAYEERRHWRSFWLVDPLDGTKEFVKRNGEFSVNIALVRDSVPILGVVHAPVAGVTYTGMAAHADRPPSAWRFDAEGGGQPVRTHPPVKGEAVRVMVSRSHSNQPTLRFIDDLEQRFPRLETIPRGSAIKICLVADGTAHYYPRLGPTMWWDTAAAQAVLEAAGGEMFGADDHRPLRYGGEALSNPGFVAAYSAAADLTGLGTTKQER